MEPSTSAMSRRRTSLSGRRDKLGRTELSSSNSSSARKSAGDRAQLGGEADHHLFPQEPRGTNSLPARASAPRCCPPANSTALHFGLDARDRHQLHVDARARAPEDSHRGFRAAPCTSRQGSSGCKPRNALGEFLRSTTKRGRPQSVPFSRATSATPDELVYERVFLSDGGWRESWVTAGALESRRVLHPPSGPPFDLRREFGNS